MFLPEGRSIVPNVPCGVERRVKSPVAICHLPVPNVPCGVESWELFSSQKEGLLFLMYRVELKAMVRRWFYGFCQVPNVPCGVESEETFNNACSFCPFLMYRVELKGLFFGRGRKGTDLFLMYRVELKVGF